MAKYLGLRGNALHRAIWSVSCVAIMIFAYNQASAGNVATLPSFYNQFPQMNAVTTTGSKQQYNATILGTVVSLYTLLGAFGALACTALGDILGRRWTIWISCLVQSIGCLLMATSFQFAQFIVSRIFLGLGTGGIIATVSVWQAETAKANSRGEHVSSFGIFCGFGLILCLWLEFGCSYIDNSASWRFPLALPILLGAIVMAFIFKLPESPRWLVKMGRVDEAAEVLSIIHDCDTQDEQVQSEIRDIQLSIELNGSVSAWSMFKMGPQRTFHRVCLAGLIQIFLQMSGTNAVIYYSTTLFEVELGFTTTVGGILAGCLQFTLVIGSLICAFTVDRFGRRPLVLISAALNTIAMAGVAGCLSQPNSPTILKVGTYFVFMFETCYCIGFLGIPFLYASEVAPVHLRAAVCGVSTAISWLFNYLVAEITPIGFTSIHWKYFFIYMCTNAWAGITVYFFYPETAGRSLEEIDEIFTKSKSIFDTVAVAKALPRQQLSTFLREEAKHDTEIKEVVEKLEDFPITPFQEKEIYPADEKSD